MAKDLFHNTVKIALKKDGWRITADPYQLRYGVADVYMFLRLEPAKTVIERYKVRLIVYNPKREEIDQWIE